MNSSAGGRFLGMHLKFGQAFSLACLIEYGPDLPIESSRHLEQRKALFRSAAWYSMSEDELDQVLEHKEVAPYLASMVALAKQYKYALCAARPDRATQGQLFKVLPAKLRC